MNNFAQATFIYLKKLVIHGSFGVLGLIQKILVGGISFADMLLQFSIEADISVFLKLFFRLFSALKIPCFLFRIFSRLVSA
jgi:hypothetical protein